MLEELRKVTSHPTADEVYGMVRRRLPRVSLGTVYRNLELMSDEGLIQKLEMGGVQKRFDGNPEAHYHVRCVGCGRVGDLDMPVQRKLDRVPDGATDYKILGHRLEFIGLCPGCQTANHDHRKEIEDES